MSFIPIPSLPVPIAQGGTNSATALNNSRVMVSASGKITELNALTNGQLVIGATGGAPAPGSLVSADSSVTFTPSANGLDLSAPGAALQNGTIAYYMPSNNYPPGSVTGGVITSTNIVHVFRFFLPASITVNAISFNLVTPAAGLFGVGIYSAAAGAKLVAADAVDVSTGTVKSTTVSATILRAGMYWMAWTCSTTAPQFTVVAAVATYSAVLNAGTAHQGTAANASAGGVLPATLGVISVNSAIQILVAKLQG